MHLRLCLSLRQRRVLRLLGAQARHRGISKSTLHPVMRSFEPGEAWRWCFVHEVSRADAGTVRSGSP